MAHVECALIRNTDSLHYTHSVVVVGCVMRRECLFDRLPVELLHTLFTYFLAHEILFSFSDVSDHVTGALLTYSGYQLNFNGVRKKSYDLICSRIRPEQVTSLTFSDDAHLSGVFFTRFRIEDFTRLRSLTLIRTEFEQARSIFANLHKLEGLRSLSFDTDTIKFQYDEFYLSHSPAVTQLAELVRRSHAQVLPRLTHLHLNSSSSMMDIDLPRLVHLKLGRCVFDQLGPILCRAPQLQSLEVSIADHTWDTVFHLPPNRLHRLYLKAEGNSVSMDQLEQLLIGLTHLKRLILELCGERDLLDARRWETLTTGLRSFTFKFYLSSTIDHADLRFFSTPYWTEEKRWYVARYGRCVFSGVSFVPDRISLPEDDLLISSASDSNLICSRATKLNLNAGAIDSKQYFPRVTTLELTCSISSTTITKMIDMRRIVRMDIIFLDLLLPFLPLKSNLPHLTTLHVEQSVTVETVLRLRVHRLSQIRDLKICEANEHVDYMTEELLHIFPSVEHFHYSSRNLSARTMLRFVHGFAKLCDASFSADTTFRIRERKMLQNPDLFVHKHATCRIHYTINSRLPFLISWSLNPQVRTSLPSPEYYWHRGKYILRRALRNLALLLRQRDKLACVLLLSCSSYCLQSRPACVQFTLTFLLLCFVSTIINRLAS